MAAVSHYLQDLFGYVAVKCHVEVSAYHLVVADVIVHIPQTLEANFHELGFLMLNSKDHYLKNQFEGSWI